MMHIDTNTKKHRKVIILAILIFPLFLLGFLYLRVNLGGGGGANHIVPDVVVAGEPTIITIVLSTWGGGGNISGRYTNITFGYRIVGEDTFAVLEPIPVALPKNYQDAMARKDGSQYEAYAFTIPAFPPGTEGEIEYYLDTALDGHLNHQSGVKTIRLSKAASGIVSQQTLSPMTPGEEIEIVGTVIKNVVKIDAPSHFDVIESRGSSARYISITYGGDLCGNTLSSGYSLKEGDVVQVKGKATADGGVSVCDSSEYYIKQIIDVSSTPEQPNTMGMVVNYDALLLSCTSDCCRQSVQTMSKNQFLPSDGTCPTGFTKNMMRCVESKSWCEPTPLEHAYPN